MGDARKTALAVLERCRRNGAWSDAALGSAAGRERLDARDRGLAAALGYGVLQNQMLLDYLLQSVSSRALSRIEPKVLDILRVSAYQLFFLEKIPASAAVNEGVRLCRELGYARATGYVNAVLRKLAENPVIPEIGGGTAEQLSIRYSHPKWLVEYLLQRLSEEEAEGVLRCDNAPAPAALQVNTLKTDAETLLSSLREDGIAAETHPCLPDCLVASEPGDLTRSEAFRKGWFYVQDAAAKLAVMAAGPQAGERILDVCAAPGGKSFAAAILSGGQAEITACDIHENKLKRIRAGAERLGLEKKIQTLARDARTDRPDWREAYDLVIADAPCSGLGVIRKKPDIRYKDPAAFDALPEIQRSILEHAAVCVRPGGRLLYATCTIRREENEDVVRRFLAEQDAFLPEDFETPIPGAVCEDGMLQLWPQRHGTDGFFIAKLRRNR